jgi:hypothetical protein
MPTDREHTETARKIQESRRNAERFDSYNLRRQAASMPPLKWADYCARKHGQVSAMGDWNWLTPKPTHRDNILLFTR